MGQFEIALSIDLGRGQCVDVWSDGSLSTGAMNGDNLEVDLDRQQTKQVYLKLKEIYGDTK